MKKSYIHKIFTLNIYIYYICLDKGEIMNITVIKLKDIIKYIICLIIVITAIFILINVLKEEFEDEMEKNLFYGFNNSSFLYCLKLEVPLFKSNERKVETNKRNFSEVILGSQIALIDNINKNTSDYISKNEESKAETYNEIVENKDESIENIILPDKANTQSIFENNLKENYNSTLDGKVKINNQTDFDISEIARKL